ncbi:MAG: hypothetical protein KIT36_09865 [Alphaproteobacteria bacterium]|nr:hypothetical protein [Alphaproteobacteria bacterium]
MIKPLTRRTALPLLFASFAAPTAAGATLQVAAAPLLDGQPVVNGYGRCSACACPAYAGNYNVCQNCGHNYATHW